MTMSEYEERFRPPGPSFHQTYAATRGRTTGRRRIWLVAAAVGVLTLTCRVASHHAVHGWTSTHSRTTAVEGQRPLMAVSDEFIVFLCGKPVSGVEPTVGEPDTLAVYPATTRPIPDVRRRTSQQRLGDRQITTPWNALHHRASGSRPQLALVQSV